MKTEDIIEKLAYVAIALTAYVIKYYKDKRNAKKNTEDLRVQLAEQMLKVAEEARLKAEDDAARIKEELKATAARLAEETSRQAAEEKRLKEDRAGMEINERIDKEVRHTCGKIREAYHAQRAFVIHFSNGTVTEAGIHLMKITFKHEAPERYDVEPIAKYFQEKHMPEMFKSPMTLVLAGGDYYIDDVDKIAKSDTAREEHINWLYAYKIKSLIWMPVRSRTGKIVAVFVMHWFATTSFNKSDITKMRDMKSEIEKILAPMQLKP